METKTYEEVLNETGFLFWRTVGVSMRPMIREGRDMVVIRKLQAPPRKYDVVLFRRPGVTGRGAYVLHRVLRDNGDGSYWIVGDNCWSGETVREENILGVLTGLVRRGQELRPDSGRFRAYVGLWCAPWPVRFGILRAKALIRRGLAFVYRHTLKPLIKTRPADRK